MYLHNALAFRNNEIVHADDNVNLRRTIYAQIIAERTELNLKSVRIDRF